MDYKEKFQLAKDWYTDSTTTQEEKALLERLFPELKDSEGEMIRKELIEKVKETPACVGFNDKKAVLAWLERQGEQKPADKVEPKFKVGDFIINGYGFIMQIDGIDSNMYVYHVLDNNHLLKHDITKTEESCHLWTIQDAKDGDVLTVENMIFIYKTVLASHIVSYCKLFNNTFEHFNDVRTCCEGNSKVHPATKEQCDQLEKAMVNAGYKWNKEELKLEKI